MLLSLLLLVLCLVGCDDFLSQEIEIQILSRDPFTNVSYVDNYDGDTITVNLPSKTIPDVFRKEISVRVRHIDTAEMTSRIQCERDMARKAKKAITALLLDAKRIDLENVTRDKYFRLLADITVYQRDNSRINVSNFLLKQGLAVPYDGGTKLKVSWCGMLQQYRSQK